MLCTFYKKEIISTNIVYFFKIYIIHHFRTPYYTSLMSLLTSQSHASAMLLLLIVRNEKVQVCGYLQCHNVYTQKCSFIHILYCFKPIKPVFIYKRLPNSYNCTLFSFVESRCILVTGIYRIVHRRELVIVICHFMKISYSLYFVLHRYPYTECGGAQRPDISYETEGHICLFLHAEGCSMW